MKQCVIFDMDGVIIDSEPIHMACEQKIFRLLGISISNEEHNALIGTTDVAMWTSIGQKHTLPIQICEIIQLNKSLFMEYLKREVHLKPVPHVSELITNLYKNDFSLALASSSSFEQIDYILNDLSLKHYFHTLISGEDVKESKPHPEIFLKVSESVGIDPRLCIVIEDSYNGVIAAKSAKMKCIGYINPNSGNQDLSKADIVIRSFRDISVISIKSMLLPSV